LQRERTPGTAARATEERESGECPWLLSVPHLSCYARPTHPGVSCELASASVRPGDGRFPVPPFTVPRRISRRAPKGAQGARLALMAKREDTGGPNPFHQGSRLRSRARPVCFICQPSQPSYNKRKYPIPATRIKVESKKDFRDTSVSHQGTARDVAPWWDRPDQAGKWGLGRPGCD